MGGSIILVCHIYKHCFEYLEVWEYLANVILSKPKRRKHGFITYDCDFIGFACNISCYRFFIIKSDILDCNVIIESKISIFLKYVFPLKNKEKLFHEFFVASNKLLMMYKN